MDSSIKTRVWIIDMKILRKRMGNGIKKGASKNNTATTMCPPSIFPNNRTVRERGRTKWLTNSIITISGVSHHTGPINCLIYLTP